MKTAEIIGISRHRILRDGDGVTTLVGINGCPCLANIQISCLEIWTTDCQEVSECFAKQI